MQVVVKQVSGLGNQLFQYAAGLYYSKILKADLRLAIEPSRRAFSHGAYPRPFLLPKFQVTAPMRELSRHDRLFLSQRRSRLAIAAPLGRALGVQIVRESPEQRYTFVPSLQIKSETKMVYLVGYWQTSRLVDAVADDLRRELRLQEGARGRNHEVLRQIESTPDAVSLHIRRGDYALAAEGNIVLPDSYYRKAISIMQERLADPTFFVFSDDMRFAKEHLPQAIRRIFVEHNDDLSSHEDLRLMAACDHHILANSTFSWWGAWLNGKAGKLVIAPRHWLLEESSYFPDLLPLDWLLLDTARDRPSEIGLF